MDATARDTLFFGRYPQQSGSGKPAPIQWEVLETDGEDALLISRLCLDAQLYCQAPQSGTPNAVYWEYSPLRSWLNEDFRTAAFSPAEQQCLRNTVISTHPDASWEKQNNFVFLLSLEQLLRFYPSPESRCAAVSPYARSRGMFVHQACGCWWILPCAADRDGTVFFSPHPYPTMVLYDGMIQSHGRNIYHSDCGVRPVIRVRLKDALRISEGIASVTGHSHSVPESSVLFYRMPTGLICKIDRAAMTAYLLDPELLLWRESPGLYADYEWNGIHGPQVLLRDCYPVGMPWQPGRSFPSLSPDYPAGEPLKTK